MHGVRNNVPVDIYFTVFTVPTCLYCIGSGRGVKVVVNYHSTLLPTESRFCAVCVSVWSCSI